MPAPSKDQLEGVALGLLEEAGIRGQFAPKLAAAIAEAWAGALLELRDQAQVVPGVACTPAATAAPGQLL